MICFFNDIIRVDLSQVNLASFLTDVALQLASSIHGMHCSQVGLYLGTRVPTGTFFNIWVSKGSLFSSKVPIFPSCRLMYVLKITRTKPVCLQFAFNVACVK